MTQKTIFLAAGGTGGHVFPACALAEDLIKKGHKVHFITDGRGKKFASSYKNLSVLALPIAPRKSGMVSLALLLLSLIPSFFLSFLYFLKHRPTITIGFGGFPSTPPLLVAILMRLLGKHKIILHEQNAFIGRVNKRVLPFVDYLAASFPKTHGLPGHLQNKVSVTGNLVRSTFEMTGKEHPYEAPGKTGDINILVIGGSQGAKAFSTLIPQALETLPAPLKKRLHVTQQSRPEVLEETKKTYASLGIRATIEPFFPKVHLEMQKAHLIIARSGSSSVFEIASMGRPAIYIPFPYAMDNHQFFNAKEVAALQGGWVCEESKADPIVLGKHLENLLKTSKMLASAAQNVHDLVEKKTLACFEELMDTPNP